MLILSPKKIARVLTAIVVCLVVLSLIGQFSKYILGYGRLLGFVPLTDLNGEQNIPAWFSSSLLLLCSGLLAAVALLQKGIRDRFVRHWFALSGIFLFLSLDEAVSLHERTIVPLRTFFNASGFIYSAWVLLGGAFVGLFLLAYLKFIIHLPSRTRFLFIGAGALYIGGTLGAEIIHGYYLDFHGKDMVYALIATVEECLEMMGAIVFIYALLSHIQEMGNISLCIDNERKPMPQHCLLPFPRGLAAPNQLCDQSENS